MRILTWIVAIFVLAVVQAGLLAPLHIFPVNLILLLVVASVLFSYLNQTLLLAVAGGIFLDWLSGAPDGLLSLTLLATALMLYFLFNQFFSRSSNRWVMSGAVVFGSLMFNALFLLFNQIYGLFGARLPIVWGEFFLTQVSLGLMWNLAFAYPIFYFYPNDQSIRD